ncbi:acetolactate synthase small subunit [Acetivibrio sp. MSJd-27]|jgi:acetolactate synthase, small subunit|uniref:acetolactate synthase small subunit n=1 Tax=Acetivibrio sp. MSJd-27 TaxID=2841523 RepID=UPI0015ACC035|nr:acetolactate synthase small subunit [Acetivibrio sp. MSJd-27]MBU5451190.1 acetolactate synthase small subunit [Acetivibrio sp. MSJd-27]
MKHIVSALVYNRSGVLTRISGMFSRRGFNIDSLAVGTTEDPSISRMTIVANGDDATIDQMLKQLEKLVDVITAKRLKPKKTVARQLALFKVKCDGETRGEIVQIAEIFRAKVIDVSSATLTIEITGAEDKVAALYSMLEKYGILEVVKTGAIAIERGEKILNIERMIENGKNVL